MAARDELFRHVFGRLERMARKMLRDFPTVARWEETGDILNRALIRLLRALDEVTPDSVRGFLGLVAQQLRRTLLDLARQVRGAAGLDANHASHPLGGNRIASPPDPPDPRNTAAELDRWTAFHEAIEALPEREREVFSLVFYHDWTRLEVAGLLQLSERTVRRDWFEACEQLRATLKGNFPSA
jgi:RNA polymerase sigma-70 factor (ECF subfamily)